MQSENSSSYKRSIEELEVNSSSEEPGRKKHHLLGTAVRNGLQDPALLEVVSKFRSVSVHEIRKLKVLGIDSQQAIDSIMTKLRSYDDHLSTSTSLSSPSSSSSSSFSQITTMDEIASQFLPEEIDLVMELAGVRDKAGAARILILREEIYKLRKEGFDTSSIVELLIQRISKPSPIFSFISSSGTSNKREQPPRELSRDPKRQKSNTTDTSTSPSFSSSSSSPLFQSQVSSIASTPLTSISSTTTPSSYSTSMVTYSSPSSFSSSSFSNTSLTISNFERLISATAPSALEKMRQLKQMRKARLLLRVTGNSGDSSSSSSFLTKRTAEQPPPFHHAEKHRTFKKFRSETTLLQSQNPSSSPSSASAVSTTITNVTTTTTTSSSSPTSVPFFL
jgi:hypothetical protein